jgi:hypothetical protein
LDLPVQDLLVSALVEPLDLGILLIASTKIVLFSTIQLFAVNLLELFVFVMQLRN